MRKLILAMATISFVGISAFANGDDAKKTEALNKMKESCIKDMQEGGLDEANAKDFCECIATKAKDNLTEEEIVKMSNQEEATPEEQQKMQEVMMPCMEDLQKKMGGGQ